jgi:hypothetical protein
MSDQILRPLNDSELRNVSGGYYNGAVFVYPVKPNDTLNSVAAHYNTTAQVLCELNSISDPTLPIATNTIFVPSNF